MPEIEFTVECEMRGHGALQTEWGDVKNGERILYVTPCEACADYDYDRGKEDGESDA